LNAPLDAETDRLCGARRYDHAEGCKETRTGSYSMGCEHERKQWQSCNADLRRRAVRPFAEKHIDWIRTLKIVCVSFHIEVSHAPVRLVQGIKAAGAKAGIAFNPSTPVEALRHILDDFNGVLILTIESGFATTHRVEDLKHVAIAN
jgi:Ribulose-phosphate 3 epimerase family